MRLTGGFAAPETSGGARSLCEGRHRYEYSLQGIQIITKIASITNTDRVTLAAFNSCSDRLSTDSGLDHIIDIVNPQPIPSSGLAIDSEIKKISARRPFGECTAGVRKVGQRALDTFWI